MRILDVPIQGKSRVYVYNARKYGDRRRVYVRIVNKTSGEASFDVVASAASTPDDASFVASKATGCFWLASWTGTGHVATIGAGKAVDLVSPAILYGSNATFNSIIQLNPHVPLAPGSFRLEIIVAPADYSADVGDGSAFGPPPTPKPGGPQHPNGTFASNMVQESTYLMTADTPPRPPIGTPPPDALKIPDTGGTFGVKYTMTFHIRNDSNSDRTYDVYFEPRGGGAQATFVTQSGVMAQTDLLCGPDLDMTQCVPKGTAKTRYRIPALSKMVKAHQTAPDLVLNVFGEGDSSYPAYLELGEGLESQDASIRGPHGGHLSNFNGPIGQLTSTMASECPCPWPSCVKLGAQ